MHLICEVINILVSFHIAVYTSLSSESSIENISINMLNH